MVMCPLCRMSVCIVYLYMRATYSVQVFGDTWHVACVYMRVYMFM